MRFCQLFILEWVQNSVRFSFLKFIIKPESFGHFSFSVHEFSLAVSFAVEPVSAVNGEIVVLHFTMTIKFVILEHADVKCILALSANEAAESIKSIAQIPTLEEAWIRHLASADAMLHQGCLVKHAYFYDPILIVDGTLLLLRVFRYVILELHDIDIF